MDKNKIPCIYLKNGLPMQGFYGVRERKGLDKEAVSCAVDFRDAGAGSLVVFDFSDGAAAMR